MNMNKAVRTAARLYRPGSLAGIYKIYERQSACPACGGPKTTRGAHYSAARPPAEYNFSDSRFIFPYARGPRRRGINRSRLGITGEKRVDPRNKAKRHGGDGARPRARWLPGLALRRLGDAA